MRPLASLARRRGLAPGLGLALALLAAACRPGASPAPAGTAVALAPCHLGAPGLAPRVAARCGTVRVPENPAKPEGRRLDLRVAVVPALNRDPRPDPLAFLAGGPGQAATEAYPYLHGALAAVNRDRDILLLDQRGTGGSGPLRCPDAPADTELTELSDAAVTALARRCRQALEPEADLTQYGTARAVEDLDAVREALGYETLNLYGVSYGSRVALAYLRRFPERVRAMVLDGVAPPDLPLGRDLARDAQRALDLLLGRCEADAACAAAFPALRAQLAELTARLAEAPAQVSLAHPSTGAPTTLELGPLAFGQALRLLSYAPETVALLPLLVDAAARGEPAGLAAQALMTGEQLADSLAGGMGNSVVCGEDLPFFTAAEAAASSRGSILGETPARLLALTCAQWPRSALPAGARAPVRSEVPALLLSGEADPVTPPANAEHAAATLPRSRHIIAPGQGHGILARGCVPRLVAEFLEAGEATGLDAACVAELAATPFFVGPTGPEP